MDEVAWISEIHYQNDYASSSDVAEYVEISLSPDDFARAGDFEFATYQETGALTFATNLGALTPVIDPNNGHYIYTIFTGVSDPNDNGVGSEDEAVALIDNSLPSPVVSFFDIGGGTTAITATDGPAAGETSVNIPASALETSIQFTRNGDRIDGPVTQNSSVVCFCENTRIETSKGQVAVEDLEVGDLVLNAEGDFVPLRWIGARRIRNAELSQNPRFCPVRIKSGSLGGGLPMRDLLVSRQHRILIKSKIAERVVGMSEVLVAAIKLTDLPGIFVDTEIQQVKYFHLLFDSHQIIYAERAAAESLFTGPEALKAVSPAAKSEILNLFPELYDCNPGTPARCIPNGRMQKEIVSRHAKNFKPMQKFADEQSLIIPL